MYENFTILKEGGIKMKRIDIVRLERALVRYEEIVEFFSKIEDSIWESGKTDSFSTGESVLQQVKRMRDAAINEKKYLAGKINAYKELFCK